MCRHMSAILVTIGATAAVIAVSVTSAPANVPVLPGATGSATPGSPRATQLGAIITLSHGSKTAASVPPCGPLPPAPPQPGQPANFWGCADIAGYANAGKLAGAALLGPGPSDVPKAALLALNIGNTANDQPCPPSLKGNGYSGVCILENVNGELDYNGLPELPPARATFLTFGFMPTTATVEFTEVGLITIDSAAQAEPPFLFSVTSTAQLSMGISDVKVNGQPLDVGTNCHTAQPITLTLTGGTPSYTQLLGPASGGPLTGYATIPPFTGCGLNENLDPLFDASLSGPGNYVKMTQGRVCEWQYGPFPINYLCPPTPPTPQR